MATVLTEVDSWPVEKRLRLLEAIWDNLVETSEVPELTEAQRAELDCRLEALDANPQEVVSWEAVQEYVRRPR